MSFHVLIPARYASSRFPGKPLADIAGQPMVVRVCERAAQSGAASVHVATDDERIAAAVRAAGHGCVMTRADHPSGTDRIAEAGFASQIRGRDIVVNVQGDEPLISPELIAEVAAAPRQAQGRVDLHRLPCDPRRACPRQPQRGEGGPGRAWLRAVFLALAEFLIRGKWAACCYRHAGIYGYRVDFLKRYAALAPSPLEKAEALEQLRALWHGHRIAVAVSETEIPPGVDTPQDLEAVRRMLA